MTSGDGQNREREGDGGWRIWRGRIPEGDTGRDRETHKEKEGRQMKEGKWEIVIEEWYHVYLLLYSFYQCLEKHFGSEFFTELREAERKLLECSKALPDTIEIEPIRIDTGAVKGGEVASF